MKTRKNFTAGMKLLMILAMIAALSGSCNKRKSNEIASPNPDSVFVNVDSLPVFNGGDAAILTYIAEKTVYPAEAAKENIQGKVIVRFIVEKDGTVTAAEVVKGVDPLLDAEAVRVVSSLPKFAKPGINKGQPVRVYFMVPIQYALK